MPKKSLVSSAAILSVLVFLLFLPHVPSLCAQSSKPEDLEKAVARLRKIKQREIPESQQEAKAKEIDAAWDVIRAAGPAAVVRLKEEVRRVEAGKESDDYFKLNASALLWLIGKLDEAESIAAIWRTTPLDAQYNYVFYTAMEAAATHDARALPMLKAVLRDDKGGVYLYKHSMDVQWPLTLQFIWGAYGPIGLPVLTEVIQTSTNPIELKSAMFALSAAYHVEALAGIRALINNSDSEVRYVAIRSLGLYGHPQDAELLISGLRSKSDDEVFQYVYALYEYEDLRAVPFLIPLLKAKHPQLRSEVMAALMHLSCPASFDALETTCRTTADEKQKTLCNERVAGDLKELGLSWKEYVKMSQLEKENFFKELHRKSDGEFELKKDDPKLSHAQLIEVLNDWKSNGRAFSDGRGTFEKGSGPNEIIFRSSKYGWVEERHILSVASATDIKLLREVRGSIYRRLSDEALSEISRLDVIMRRLIRSLYRKVVGLTDKVEVSYLKVGRWSSLLSERQWYLITEPVATAPGSVVARRNC